MFHSQPRPPLRRTKIVATLGPASDREGVLEAMLAAGVDVVRLNFSHGSPDDHRRRLERVREIAARWAGPWPPWATCRAPRSASPASGTGR
ncbi:hypothetical protein Q427_13870 [Halomonas sp. BC04]|nr:hypothetical protein Q427_13870 [Halomonas sp. BC04]